MKTHTNDERNELADIIVKVNLKEAFKIGKEKGFSPQEISSILTQQIVVLEVFERWED